MGYLFLSELIWKKDEDNQSWVSSISGTNCDILTASNWACTSMPASDVWWIWFWQRKKGIQSERNTTGYGDKEMRFLGLCCTLSQFENCNTDGALFWVCVLKRTLVLPKWKSVCLWFQLVRLSLCYYFVTKKYLHKVQQMKAYREIVSKTEWISMKFLIEWGPRWKLF